MKKQEQISNRIDAGLVVDALCGKLGAKSQTELAKHFGRKLGAVQGWERRGYFTAEQIVSQLVWPALKATEKKASTPHRWKRADDTIQSMITVKAGTLISRMRNPLIAERKRCEECGCRDRSRLQLHHTVKKAEVFRGIVKRNRLSFGPNDPISNILRGLDLLMKDPKFRDTKHMTLLCDKCHREKHGK